jgi:N-acyl-D-aspartate/D-glutamate deacylase
MEASAREGAQIYGLLRAMPFDRRLTLKRTTYFNGLAYWRDIMEGQPLETRLATFADPANRPKLRDAFDNPERTTTRGQIRPPIRPDGLFVSKVKLDRNQPLVGRSVVAIGAETGRHPVDVILDLAVEEGLDTEFQAKLELPEDDAPKGRILQSMHALPYQSDAGAHINSDCMAGESTYVLGYWVREKQVLSLEDAIRRVTALPAHIAGLHDRGIIREGLAADLMVFDPDTIANQPKELVQDVPGGETRWIQKAAGVHQVIVGGEVVVSDGAHTGALPGRVLRRNGRSGHG